MLETILFVFGMLAFIDALFKKWHTYEAIEVMLVKASEKIKIKLIFDLAFCMFCQRFWMAVIITVALGFFSEFNFELIFAPMIVIGLFNLLSKEL